MREIKAHPLGFFMFLSPVWLITIVPFARRLLSFRYGTIFLAGFVAALVLLSVLRARAVSIAVLGDMLVFKKGLLFKSEEFLPISSLASITSRQNPILSLCRAEVINIESEAENAAKSIKILLRRRDFERILEQLNFQREKKSIRMGAGRITLMTAAISSAAVGVFVLVPTANRIGRLLDFSLAGRVLTSVRSGALFSSAFAVLLALFLFFYAVSFVFLLIRNISMRIGLSNETIYIAAGVFPRRKCFFKKRMIAGIFIEQRPLIRFSRRYIIRVTLPSGGKSGGESGVVVPIAKKGEVAPFLKNIFGVARPESVIGAKAGRFRFVRWRLLLLCFAPTPLLFAVQFPAYAEALCLLVLFLAVSLIYGLSIGFLAPKITALSRSGDHLFAAGVKGFTVRELFCRRERAGAFKLRRYPADIRAGSCILAVKSCCKNDGTIKVKYIDYSAAREYCRAFWKNQ